MYSFTLLFVSLFFVHDSRGAGGFNRRDDELSLTHKLLIIRLQFCYSYSMT